MERDIVGLLPAAGNATRLGLTPCSKEILPVGVEQSVRDLRSPHIHVAMEHSLRSLASAGISTAYVIIAPQKWDIPAYLSRRGPGGLSLTYITVSASPDVPTTLDSAYRFVGDREVALLFPDIVYEPADALTRIRHALAAEDADVVLALVPSDRGDKVDLVDLDRDGRVVRNVAKPGAGVSGWTWVAAVWKPRFSRLLHDEVAGGVPVTATGAERYIGDVLNRAIEAGLSIHTRAFPDGVAHDVGTLAELAAYWRRAPG